MRSINRRDFLQDSALVAATLAGAGIICYRVTQAPKQRRTLEELSARVKNGETVTLIGESGPPLGARWQPSNTDALTMLDRGQVFQISADEQRGMLELLPSSPKRYRLRAQIQHSDSPTLLGKAGIYFAHGKHPTVEGTTHCFFRVDFNDRVPTLKPRDERITPKSQVNLTLPTYRQKKEADFFHQVDISSAIAQQFIPAGQVESMPWRSLEVEVTSDWIKTFWEGNLIKTSWWGGAEREGVEPRKVLELVSLF